MPVVKVSFAGYEHHPDVVAIIYTDASWQRQAGINTCFWRFFKKLIAGCRAVDPGEDDLAWEVDEKRARIIGSRCSVYMTGVWKRALRLLEEKGLDAAYEFICKADEVLAILESELGDFWWERGIDFRTCMNIYEREGKEFLKLYLKARTLPGDLRMSWREMRKIFKQKGLEGLEDEVNARLVCLRLAEG